MTINVYFGKGNGTYVDDRKPLEQVKLVKGFIEKGKDFEIVTYSPYVIEAVDAYKKDKEDIEVKYFNDGEESNISLILSEISEAFFKIQDYKENK
jgi:hypothetical protein